MTTVKLRVDTQTYQLLIKLRRITPSISRIVERAIDVCNTEDIAPPAYTHKEYNVSISDQARLNIDKVMEQCKLTVCDAVSAVVQKYLWSIKEGLEDRDVSISQGSVGVTFEVDYAEKVHNYMKEYDRTFGYLLKRATEACIRGEIKFVAPHEGFRMSKKGTRCEKFYGTISPKIAGYMTRIMGGRALARSSLARAIVASYLDQLPTKEQG